jgi:hypothetical protein
MSRAVVFSFGQTLPLAVRGSVSCEAFSSIGPKIDHLFLVLI